MPATTLGKDFGQLPKMASIRADSNHTNLSQSVANELLSHFNACAGRQLGTFTPLRTGRGKISAIVATSMFAQVKRLRFLVRFTRSTACCTHAKIALMSTCNMKYLLQWRNNLSAQCIDRDK